MVVKVIGSTFLVCSKAEYSLSDRGKRAIDIIHVIRDYGLELIEEFGIEH